MSLLPRVAFYTLGCKLNFSETSTIARLFEGRGYQRVEFEENPDLFVINTCSVTENADKKCRSLVNKALRISPHAYIAIIGCYAQLKPDEIAAIPGVDLVLGASEKFNLPEYIDGLEKLVKAEIHACEIDSVSQFVPSFSGNDRTRSFFKIQDGCDYSCSFCTIPLARGKSRSGSIGQTVNAARKLIDETGAKELVLTGVNTGDFGRSTDENFYELIKVLDTIESVDRFRISSIEPNLITEEIICFVANSQRFVPHFHIPLQSGSNKILRLMRRRYQRELYQQRVNFILEQMPHCCIGVDVIVGFPGESNQDFEETYTFLNELPISYLHVFTYSERVNTQAVNLPDAVPLKERARRSALLHKLSDQKRRAFYEQNLGKTLPVLWEAAQTEGQMFGFTPNYIKVQTNYNPLLVNTISTAILEKLNADQTHVIAGQSSNQLMYELNAASV
jgi:threonylcarbamoyladenosine tRNA methylthiotransferase MtaB